MVRWPWPLAGVVVRRNEMELGPMDLIASVLDTMSGKGNTLSNYKERKVACHETEELFVSTAWVADAEWYETAIGHQAYNDGNLIIVEQYGQDRQAAEEGHKEWVGKMAGEELPEYLEDIDAFNIGLSPFYREEQ